MADRVELIVGGKRYAGWKTVSVERSLDAFAGAFSLTLTDAWRGQPERWDIGPGDACQLWLGDDELMNGYIDRVDHKITGESRTVAIAGRDRAADLVDCSAVAKPGTWTGKTLVQICAELCRPFNIAVTAAAPDIGAPFPRIAIEPGESVYELIARLCRQRAVLAWSDESGSLILGRPGDTPGGYSLTLGERPVEAITFTDDASERFSDYFLKGYGSGKQGSATRPQGQTRDAEVGRYRPLLLINADETTPAELANRARWEATTRAGRAQSAQVTVSGWRDPAGQLYTIDRVVDVAAPAVLVDETLLLAGVKFELGLNGSRANLTFTRREAFSLIDLAAKHQAAKKGLTPL